MARRAEIIRSTSETSIALTLDLDGTGKSEIDSGIGFFDHMLTLFSRHGGFDLVVNCNGDTNVDGHHTVEDIGICLGDAFRQAIGDARGICRYGDITLPMDEALIMCAVDVSGRGRLSVATDISASRVGEFDVELLEEFLQAFVQHAGLTLHIRQLAGTNAHHIIEGCFKAMARALSKAAAIDEKNADSIPSTKGVL